MAAIDLFPQVNKAMDSPTRQTIDIDSQKSDTTELDYVTRGISVNVAGDVKCVFQEDTTTRTISLLAGIVYPFRLKQVYSSVTDATGIIGYL